MGSPSILVNSVCVLGAFVPFPKKKTTNAPKTWLSFNYYPAVSSKLQETRLKSGLEEGFLRAQGTGVGLAGDVLAL